MALQRIELTRPDDWHLHLRDGDRMAAVLAHTAERFGRAIVMPNLAPPITTVEAAHSYRERIRAALPSGARFDPLMTLYLTDETTPAEIRLAKESGFVHGVKLYPAGATTNSAHGVTAIDKLEPVLSEMERQDVPLLVHGEVTDPGVDVFDRERVFLERILAPWVELHAGLRVVVEHVTTAEAVDFVLDAREGVAATITPQHLLLDRNALFAGGLRPHHYCLPVLKRGEHRTRLLEAATSGDPRFFLGTDSAPHARTDKESDCGCAGIYSAHAGLELYAEAFEAAGALDRLEGFASHHGAQFYRLPPNTERVALVREPWTVPSSYPFGADELRPFRADEEIGWRFEGVVSS